MRMAHDPFTFLGVLHLPPLPGAPRGSAGRSAVFDRALSDADALVAGGADGFILENLGDAPFCAGRVDPHVPAMLAVLGDRLRARFGRRVTIGVNVLRNDVHSALAAALACGADFVRVNVHVGATWTDQGLIQGDAHRSLRYRRELGLDAEQSGQPRVALAADVLVKHGVPAGAVDAAEVARETARRGGADVLIVTGRATGAPADLSLLSTVRAAVPERPVWVGSGVTLEQAPAVAEHANGAIVGTALHADGDLSAPLDPDRVRAMARALGRR